MDLPNEIICQFYQFLNPADQLKLAATSKSIRECIPDWKRDHQKSFINCINQINEIKHDIYIWTKQINRKPHQFPTIYGYKGKTHIMGGLYNSSRLIIDKKVTHYCSTSESHYGARKITNSDLLYLYKENYSTYNADRVISDLVDIVMDSGLTVNIVTYKRTFY